MKPSALMFKKLMTNGATKAEIKKAIKMAEKEIECWTEFLNHLEILIKYK
jgi:hypothetical protein